MARRRKKHEEGHENAERWLLTYADMITLLMLFFIVLYSMSNIDSEKYKEVSQALEEAFSGGNFGFFEKASGSGGILEGVQKPTIEAKSERKAKLTEELKRVLRGNNTSVSEHADGISISMASDLFFAPASAEISEDGLSSIRRLAVLLSQIKEDIRVEGHTDTVPMEFTNPDNIADNWELSSKRALTVLGSLIAYGVPERQLSTAAFGSTRPVKSNDTPEGRANNRRVELIILFNEKFGTEVPK